MALDWIPIGDPAPRPPRRHPVPDRPQPLRTPIQRYRDAVLASAPFGYWRLGDASGTIATDAAAVPHNGTYTGAVTLAQPGALVDGDRAVDFLGSTGQVTNTATLASVNASTSIECWCWADTISAVNRRMLFAGRNTSFLNLEPSGVPLFSLHVNGVQIFLLGATASLVGAWHYLVGTWDGDKLRVYVDGVLNATSISFAPGATDWGTGTFRIGAYDGTVADNFWDGRIDEVALYPSALSAATIAARWAFANAPLTFETDLLLTESFFAVDAPAPRRRRRSPIVSEAVTPVWTGAMDVLSWLPQIATAPRRRRPLIRSTVIEPPSGDMVNVGIRMAWLPRYSARPRPRIKAASGPGMTVPIQPSVVAAGVQCVEWGPDSFTLSTLTAETTTVSTLLVSALTISTFLNEDLC